MKRPWGGQIELNIDEELPDYDPNNPLCPGNVRASGEVRFDLYFICNIL